MAEIGCCKEYNSSKESVQDLFDSTEEGLKLRVRELISETARNKKPFSSKN